MCYTAGQIIIVKSSMDCHQLTVHPRAVQYHRIEWGAESYGVIHHCKAVILPSSPISSIYYDRKVHSVMTVCACVCGLLANPCSSPGWSTQGRACWTRTRLAVRSCWSGRPAASSATPPCWRTTGWGTRPPRRTLRKLRVLYLCRSLWRTVRNTRVLYL